MQILRRIGALAPAMAGWRTAGDRIALVPTMGALHAGHMALVDAARAQAERVVATIFINPLQFGPSEDLDRYPRSEAEDIAFLKAHGCDLLWIADAADLYPPGFATTVSVAGVATRWEGDVRPGHFAGVATVVAKLFTAVSPDLALFGEKDFQQLTVIRRMTADLGLGVEITGVATVREGDGLALSSRNRYLDADARKRAIALPLALGEARDSVLGGTPVADALDAAKRRLAEAGFAPIDYVALVDAASLKPLVVAAGEMRLIAAATLGSTRLIDNIRVFSGTSAN